ncbi:MAG TPA: sigma-70 family RNA polymerase sigma factor [Pirellulales bacterium]|nr:sigma-70 family RNA polymerase sigma factor [Pirellulales bacterium]
MNDDAQLIDETLGGNSAAFGRLVTKYQDRLFNTIVHVVGSADEAQDVVQDAFVQSFLKLKSFQGNSAFFTWLYRIAFNVAISQRRRRKPTVSVEQHREASGQEPLDHAAAPTERLESQERVEQVRQALATLSEEHRTVVVLREIDGCCYETIAEILDLPVGTVRSRLHRARLELREQLRESLLEDPT